MKLSSTLLQVLLEMNSGLEGHAKNEALETYNEDDFISISKGFLPMLLSSSIANRVHELLSSARTLSFDSTKTPCRDRMPFASVTYTKRRKVSVAFADNALIFLLRPRILVGITQEEQW